VRISGRSPTSSPSTGRRTRTRHPSERRAAWWYRLHGYRILATNCWLAGAEVDLVARRGRTLVFCEVKSKSGKRFGDPLEMVDDVKVRRLQRVADAWLVRHPESRGLEVRFDLVAERSGRLEHVPNAF
jgi:putative endonuclease